MDGWRFRAGEKWWILGLAVAAATTASRRLRRTAKAARA
jgi:hypothetical protein